MNIENKRIEITTEEVEKAIENIRKDIAVFTLGAKYGSIEVKFSDSLEIFLLISEGDVKELPNIIVNG